MGLFFTALILYFAAAFVQVLFKNSTFRYYFLLAITFLAGIFAGIPAFKAVRSLSSDYINFVIGKVNLTFVLDNIAAPIILFLAVTVFLINLNCKNYLEKSFKKDILYACTAVASVFTLMSVVNAVLFTVIFEILILSFLLLFKATKKYIIISQIGAVLIACAFGVIYYQTGTVEFGKLFGLITPPVFVMIFAGVLISACSVILSYTYYKGNDLPVFLLTGAGLPAFAYVLIRFLFLWRTPEEFISYMILVAGFFIAYKSVITFDSSEPDFRRSVLNISYKNTGLMLIALSIAMFGMILKNLPTTACALFAVYFLIFNQIIGIPALLISVRNKYGETGAIEEQAVWQKFLPSDKFYCGIFLGTILSIPPFAAFAGAGLMYSSILAGIEVKNAVFLILLLITLVLMFLLEVITVRALANLFHQFNNYKKSLANALLISGFVIVFLLAGLFPHITIEFFVAPVFVFCGGNLFVPQVMLSNLSLINISFLLMVFAFYLLKFLLTKENK